MTMTFFQKNTIGKRHTSVGNVAVNIRKLDNGKMSSILKQPGENFGGISKLHYAFAAPLNGIINTIVSQNTLTISQSVFQSHFHQIEFLQESGNYDQSPKSDPHGQYFQQAIECRIPKDRNQVDDVLQYIGMKKVVLFVQDQNGLARLVGTADEGLRLLDDFRSGRRIRDANSYRLVFSGVTTQRSSIVTIQ